MSYKEETIKDSISKISENKIYLPAIQRKFVWKTDQIIDLFDSILKGYPIGTFLFWKLQGDPIKQYTFYSFILHYHDRDNYLNKTTEQPELKDEIIGVLDGQQRLSSMYVSLQGTYAYKRPYARWDDDSAFPKRYLCLNLLTKPNGNEDNENYEFKFLTTEEIANNDESHYWFPVRKVLEWNKISDCNKYAREQGYGENDNLIENLSDLWSRLTQEKLISYFEITNSDIEEILPVFVRINSGGTPLSKTDLLFSTIVASWLDGRQEIENLLETINRKGFYFSNDFVMRACLALTDCPIIFKVKTFKKENIIKIKENWSNIKNSIIKTVDLIKEFGFESWNLTSHMAVIVIAYYISKGGVLNDERRNSIKKYLILALLNQIYGGQPDRIISKIRDSLKEHNNNFELDIINQHLDYDNNLIISEERLDEIISSTKSAYTFMVLSLLYPHLKLGQIQFHQDHIFPRSIFEYDTFKEAGLENIDAVFWEIYYKRDQLPNLQLLTGSENESKNATPFKVWFMENIKDSEKARYIKEHYIPEDHDFEIKNFMSFFEKRKLILKEKLSELLDIKNNVNRSL